MDEIITLETAKLAKQKGFDIYVATHYYDGNLHYFRRDKPKGEIHFLAPNQATLQRWLREKHEIFVYLSWYDDKFTKPRWSIYAFRKGEYQQYITGNANYEKALEIGLRKGLELIK